MKDDFKNIYELYGACKISRDRAKPLFDTISKVTGIQVDTDYAYNSESTKDADQMDEGVDDPTSAISTNQAGDYLVGIMWGTGEKVLDLKPSRYVKELIDEQVVEPYYKFITDQFLYHINHHDAGFITALKPYAYEQFSFGTSGIGIYPNPDFRNRIADNAFNCVNYGVDNAVIDEGKSGMVEYVFARYTWKLNRILGEFCMEKGSYSARLMAEMPQAIQKAYQAKDYTTTFDIVFGMFPRQDFNPRLKGKRGARYRGVWFLDGGAGNKIFKEESFSERPINMARMIRIRGQVWGRSSGTMLISTIRSLNFMVGTTIDILEKMSEPALGMFNNAMMGDSVLDSSAGSLTAFNPMFTGGGNQNPIFPLYQVGDPSGIIKFLIPYLKDQVTTGFKVDSLLDMNNDKVSTATESMQRFIIRGKSLASMLIQQKHECLIPSVKRGVSILVDMNEMGVNPRTQQNAAEALKRRRPERIIPEAVLEVMESGRPWFEISFNNELEKLVRTEAVQNLMQVLQAIIAIAGPYPLIIEAVDWYKLLKAINDNLEANSQILISAEDFKAKIKQIAQEQQAAKALQAGQMGAQIGKDQAQINKLNQEANVR